VIVDILFEIEDYYSIVILLHFEKESMGARSLIKGSSLTQVN